MTETLISSPDAADYVLLNHTLTPSSDALGYVLANAGVALPADTDGTDYLLANVGVALPADPDGVDYAYVGDVDDNVPSPHLWFVRPVRGRAGDGITLTGSGMGSSQPLHNGRVEILPDGEDDWQTVTVTSWVTQPGDAAALKDSRAINPDGVVDPQHDVVDFVLPAGVVPPGLRVRVVTES